MYNTGGYECFRKCPPGYYRENGQFTCLPADSAVILSLSVRTGQEFKYFTKRPTSYSRLDLNIGEAESAAAFLEVSSVLMSLTLHVTTLHLVNYAPIVFFRARVLLGCELYYSAR